MGIVSAPMDLGSSRSEAGATGLRSGGSLEGRKNSRSEFLSAVRIWNLKGWGRNDTPALGSREVLVVGVVGAQASYLPYTEIYDKVSSNGSISSKSQKSSSFFSSLEKGPF